MNFLLLLIGLLLIGLPFALLIGLGFGIGLLGGYAVVGLFYVAVFLVFLLFSSLLR